ncbi:hypothetical protein E2C01_001712 [Portunus trituberculatus]|uniref:Uncharacterized protein n=1 Tax=Portunus trituberculatus TaxID=210409 RepID=A0A5B7CI04_PORTR|nr:hypothetical protein [Portunus trituberculatus]
MGDHRQESHGCCGNHEPGETQPGRILRGRVGRKLSPYSPRIIKANHHVHFSEDTDKLGNTAIVVKEKEEGTKYEAHVGFLQASKRAPPCCGMALNLTKWSMMRSLKHRTGKDLHKYLIFQSPNNHSFQKKVGSYLRIK